MSVAKWVFKRISEANPGVAKDVINDARSVDDTDLSDRVDAFVADALKR